MNSINTPVFFLSSMFHAPKFRKFPYFLRNSLCFSVCGAVEKKQLLREELEVNPLGAELSPDAMPDTNVLACLVKDFLRELPEPLIPLQIHAMLRDVAAVAPPNDISSSRDLVFRVLDCLPPNTRVSRRLFSG